MQINAIMLKDQWKKKSPGCPLGHNMKKRTQKRLLKGFLVTFCIK